MPQPKTPVYWRTRVKALLAQHDGQVTDRAIYQTLKAEKRVLQESPDPETRALADRYPSQRTIGRIRAEEWPNMKHRDKAQYREVYWPETMVRGDLPWEASSAVLELMAYLDVIGLRRRPPVRFAKWFWRVTQAMPRAKRYLRAVLAADLAQKEAQGEPFPRGTEWWLAYMQIPEDEERKRLYEKARTRPPEDSPIPSLSARLQASVRDGADMAFYMDLLFALGFGIQSQKRQEEGADGEAPGE